MTSIAMTEPRFWTTGRALRWTGLLLLLMIVMPIVVGVAAGYLGRLHPEQNWRTIGLIVAVALFGAGLALGGARLWIGYRVYMAEGAVGPGERQANVKRLAISGIWRDSLIVGVIIGIALSFAAIVPAGAPRIALAATIGLAFAYGMARSTIHYMRTIDEQERDANLWGAYCGVTVYAAMFFVQFLASRFGVAIPHVHDWIFAVTLVVIAGVYFWRRFR